MTRHIKYRCTNDPNSLRKNVDVLVDLEEGTKEVINGILHNLGIKLEKPVLDIVPVLFRDVSAEGKVFGWPIIPGDSWKVAPGKPEVLLSGDDYFRTHEVKKTVVMVNVEVGGPVRVSVPFMILY